MRELEKVNITMSGGLAEATFGGAADYETCHECGLYMSTGEGITSDTLSWEVFCGDTCKSTYELGGS